MIKIANLEKILFSKKKPIRSHAFVIQSKQFYILSTKTINSDAERENLQKELDYTRGFLETVLKKLNNERFLKNAPPDVLKMEKKKQSDAETKIQKLKENIQNL